jgi:hypothetical protein
VLEAIALMALESFEPWTAMVLLHYASSNASEVNATVCKVNAGLEIRIQGICYGAHLNCLGALPVSLC